MLVNFHFQALFYEKKKATMFLVASIKWKSERILLETKLQFFTSDGRVMTINSFNILLVLLLNYSSRQHLMLRCVRNIKLLLTVA